MSHLLLMLTMLMTALLSGCQNTSTAEINQGNSLASGEAINSDTSNFCAAIDSGEVKSMSMPEAKWTIPIRDPGPIHTFADAKGLVLSFPMRVDANGKATIRRMIVEHIQYVEKANGELAIAEIRGQRDDGKLVHAVDLAQGRKISTPADLVGVKVLDRSISESGLLMIKHIALASREDGLLVITEQRFEDEAGKVYELNRALDRMFSCSKTFVNVCACPNFFGFCDDSNFPNCASESCNFGSATCAAKVEINCSGFCTRDGLPGFCFYLPVLKNCGCFVVKGPDEM